MQIKIIQANYLDLQQASDIKFLMNTYSNDIMGGGESLSPYVLENLCKELAKLPHAFTVLCYINNEPAGLINCFEAFSTFKCKALINIHDVVVVKKFRKNGLSHKMLDKVEEIAISKDCCKITLEVLDGNIPAKNSYSKFGFSSYELDESMGSAVFWQKVL